jgi:uncharacterized RmlC-like cupin family protein
MMGEETSGASAFARDGFIGPVRLFTLAQCELIIRSLRFGKHPEPMDWPKGRAASDHFFYDLATRPNILALLAPMLGRDIVLWGTDILERDPGQIHPWHTDIESAQGGPRFVSAWIGLENTSRESALQMIAGSHDLGKPVQQILHERGLSRGEATDAQMLAFARETNPNAALVQPEASDGEAILYDGRIWHATHNRRSEGRRLALLLQYAAADAPVFMPDFNQPSWPLHYRTARPPVVVVSGSGDETINRLTPPPPACPESSRLLSSRVHKVEWPAADEGEPQLRRWQFFYGSTPALSYMEFHCSMLSAGHTPHAQHRHAEETLGVVLEGELDSCLDESETFANPRCHHLGRHAITFQPAFQHHRFTNSSGAPAVYVLFAWRGPLAETDRPLAEDIIMPGRDYLGSAGGEVRRQELLFERPTSYLSKLHAHATTLQPGAGYDTHVDDYDVAIVLLSGKVETLGVVAEAHGVIYYAAGEPHGIRNVGDGPASYLVFEFHAPKRMLRNRVSFPIRQRSAEASSEQAAQEFRTFWTGPPLSTYEELCLRSLLARGQRVRLYSYDKNLRVPDGVELADASEVLPAQRIHEFRHPNGETSPTPHANLFRYEALRRFGGWYCDLDILLVGDQPPAGDTYFAREDATYVNNAVIRFPPAAQVMAAAAEAARDLMGSTVWGASGPKLLTKLIEAHGLSGQARPWSAAYPVRPTEVAWLFLPEHREELEDRIAGADFVHFWNQIWRRVRIPKELGPPEGSLLDGLFRTFGLRVAPGARMSAEAVKSWFREYLVVEDAKRASGGLSSIAELTQALAQARAEARSADTASSADATREADLEAALQHARWERDELLKSTSWRVTSPLRAVSEAVRALIKKT